MRLVVQISRRTLLATLILVCAAAVAGQTEIEYTGTQSCAACHEKAAADWLGSHHDLAMQEVSEKTVLGDFEGSTFTYGDITSTFYRKDGKYWVRTDNADGALEDFAVAYVFGVYPLQQYLLPTGDGRLQALTIAWDSRPTEQGGQRWYHLYPDDVITAGDPLHWTGPYQNWNTRCAECHSTNVRKNYSPTSRSFDTAFNDIDVGCEACHGPGKQHVTLAKQDKLDTDPLAGFVASLAADTLWAWSENAAIASPSSPKGKNTQIDNCARCHARRSTLGDYHYGTDLLDTHRLALIENPLYWPDGQIRDEVYVYGSFVQSKMYQAGVVCSNCHNPHSNQLIAEGNGVCTQCHKASVFDTENHHRHPVNSTGAACVGCHMPEQVYMGVDARRDHSMRIPRPDIAMQIGAPDACTQCHTERSQSWALQAVREWGIDPGSPRNHPALALHNSQRGDVRSIPSLKRIIADEEATELLRASALNQFGQLGSPDLAQSTALLLGSTDSLLRLSAVRALSALPPQQRFLMLRPLISDPVLAVRLAVADQLADVPFNELRPQDVAQLDPLFKEYEQVQSQHLDMPSIQLQLANYWRRRGDPVQSEKALREALNLNDQLEAAYINLADLLRVLNREQEAKHLLESGIEKSPSPGTLKHALGLLEIRQGNPQLGMSLLADAAANESGATRHRYVYAVALHDTGSVEESIKLLEQLNNEYPGQPQVLYALIAYHGEQGNRAEQERYQAQLQTISRALSAR